MEQPEKIALIRKHLGSDTELQVMENILNLLDEFQSEEIKKLKEDLKEADKAIISFAKGLDKERKENKQLKEENERLRKGFEKISKYYKANIRNRNAKNKKT